ncbi:hypothetical protein [Streptomyces sp. NPDC041003]|uniref:hypothetical protein n=1 Tax=Streptomyces sp. NPDC041003 TaxID=3155730 RepID=UPI0033CD2674
MAYNIPLRDCSHYCGPDSDPTGAITTGRIADLNHAIDAGAAAEQRRPSGRRQ